MKKAPFIQKEILKTREAADLLKVTTQTIKNYIYSGKLKALKTPGGHHRIRRDDLFQMMGAPSTPAASTPKDEKALELAKELVNRLEHLEGKR